MGPTSGGTPLLGEARFYVVTADQVFLSWHDSFEVERMLQEATATELTAFSLSRHLFVQEPYDRLVYPQRRRLSSRHAPGDNGLVRFGHVFHTYESTNQPSASR